MKYSLTVRKKARANFNAIHDWYESESEGLGEEFLEELDYVLESLKQFPEIHPLIYKRTRRAHLTRFPYSVFYYLDQTKVII